MPDEMFWQVHSGLPREGPGDNDSTGRAFAMMAALPSTPCILDIACGPGMQTIHLAQISKGKVTAVDNHQPFLDELNKRAREARIDEQIETVNASMFDLPFAENSFDVIWCEGALYMMGIEGALSGWRRFLKSQAYIAFTEPVFLSNEISDEVRKHWVDDYPLMGDVENALGIIASAGYATIGHFTIPDESWWHDYYNPMQLRINQLREKYSGDPGRILALDDAQKEIDAHRKFGAAYGYEFFVVQKQ